MTHLWEHYRFTGDVDFVLDTALPISEGIIEFFKAFLIEKDGFLVNAPTISPENNYVTPDGVEQAITAGPASDNQVNINTP